jgi:hypothetical protein
VAVTAQLRPGETPPKGAIQITKLRRNYENFGLLVDFLAQQEPFGRYDLGNFTRALQHQLTFGNHVAAVTATRIVGYCGWLPTTTALASAWIDERGQLLPAHTGADAVALTVVACKDRKLLAHLIRRARDLNPGRRVYFKRQYASAERAARKSSVQNAGPR